MTLYPEPTRKPVRRVARPSAVPVVDVMAVSTPTAAPAATPYRATVGVKEMAADERPRERMKLVGAASLSVGDLLAILLNTGLPGESVLEVSQRILRDHGGLAGLMRMDVIELASIRGIGEAKAAKLKAAFELATRVVALAPDQRPRITTPDDVISLVGIEMANLEREQVRIVLLDTKHQVLAIRTVYQGSINGAPVRPAEIFREALRYNATALIMVHNHPSGDPTPSGADIAVTRDVHQAGELLGVDVLDHLVIGQGRHASLRRLGLGFPARA